MKPSRILTLLCALLLTAGLAGSVACGEEDPGQNQNQNQDNNDTNDGPDQNDGDECDTAEDCDGDDEICDDGSCVEDDDNGDNGNNGDNGDDECTDNTDCEGDDEVCHDGTCIVSENYVEPAPATAHCQDDDPPARCGEDADEFDDFGPGSYVDELWIAEEDECCVDFTGDGEIDNELANIPELIPDEDLEGVNDMLQEGIDDGEISIVLEHDGLDEIEDGAEYDINFLFAEMIDDGEATIDPASFDEGTHPQALVPDAELTEDEGSYSVEAGPGTVVLQLDAGALTGGQIEAELELDINNATIAADLVGTELDGGIALDNGEIGGVLRFEDVFDAISDVAQDCDCLGNPEQVVEFDDGDAVCNIADEIEDGDFEEGYEDLEEACEDQGDEDLCADLGQFCPGISLITALGLADVDTTGDGEADAFTAGLQFNAEAVEITGIGDGQAPDDDNGE